MTRVVFGVLCLLIANPARAELITWQLEGHLTSTLAELDLSAGDPLLLSMTIDTEAVLPNPPEAGIWGRFIPLFTAYTVTIGTHSFTRTAETPFLSMYVNDGDASDGFNPE